MSLEQFGILLGFAGALCNALNYAFSKDCVEKYDLRGIRQLIVVHVTFFVIMLPPLIFTGLYKYFSLEVLINTIYIIIPYIIAQYLIIRLLTATDSSVVSPLLTLKIPVVASISFILSGQIFSPQQLFAIGMIILLGFYFSSLSGRIKLMPLLIMICICTGYAFADYATVHFMKNYPGSNIDKTLACICWQYVIGGFIALPLMFLKKSKLKIIHLWQGKSVSLSWLSGTFCWVGCFYLAGVVEGNIIQSLRCVIGVLIAYAFFRKYIKDPNTFKKKLVIAALMFTAVFIYYI